MIYRSFGFHPLPFHAAIYGVLIANLYLTYRVVRVITGVTSAAWIATVFHAWHGNWTALHVSAGFCFDVFCYFFYAGALVAFGLGRLWLFLALYLLGLNTKEIAVSLPLVCLAWKGSDCRRSATAAIAAGLLTAIFISGHLMAPDRLPVKDPRTVARDIPGIFDAIFPQLTLGIVKHFNRKTISLVDCNALPDDLVKASELNRAMLFEVAIARGEQLLTGIEEADWAACLNIAVERQRRHFDAKLPDALAAADKTVADWVGKNLVTMLNSIQATVRDIPLVQSPKVPGFQWIASGCGDFSHGTTLIEVKCTNKHFAASDYRQIVMYWLLSYASSIERGTAEWTNGILINPRLNLVLEFSFDEIIVIIGAGRSKVELLQLFSSMVGDYSLRMLASLDE